jgi:phosphoribosylformylglycinamidine synthase subunit PurQ / glutaminase
MKAAVVVFPGTNRDGDALHVCNKLMGWEAVPIWHESAQLGNPDLVILPGGFAYGDYLRCGAIARFSPVMEAVARHARGGGLTLGICNGFQVLCEAGLLPGQLMRNAQQEFRCRWVNLRVESADSPFTRACKPGDVLRVPVAHGEGRYYASPDVLAELNRAGRVALRYCEHDGGLPDTATATVGRDGANPNGSLENIAGILSEGRNVLGLMPHPENACESALGSQDGKRLFDSLAVQHADIGW